MRRVDVRRMLSEMSAPEWLMWRVYMSLRPPSVQETLVWVGALIVQAIWNVQIAKGTKRGQAPKFRALHEFVLRLGDMPDPRPVVKRTAREQFADLKDMFMAMGKKPLWRTDGRPLDNDR